MRKFILLILITFNFVYSQIGLYKTPPLARFIRYYNNQLQFTNDLVNWYNIPTSLTQGGGWTLGLNKIYQTTTGNPVYIRLFAGDTTYQGRMLSVTGGAIFDTINLKSFANMLIVDGSYYTTIQSAINDAQAGMTILIKEGVYNENLVLKPGIRLLGTNRNKVIINGNITFANCTIENLTIDRGLSITNINTSVVDFINVNYYLSSFNVSKSILNFYNSFIGFYEGGTHSYIYDTSQINFRYSTIQIVNTNKAVIEGTFYKGFQFKNKSKGKFEYVRFDNLIGLSDSAKVYCNNYVSYWNGRFEADNYSTTEAILEANNFYLEMDNGYNFGTHNIEIVVGGKATFKLSNGTIVYKGDKGKYPMAGNSIAGGGKQRYYNVTIIDYGSALNVGPAGAYNTVAYDLRDAELINCNIVWYANHNVSAPVGAIKIQPSIANSINTKLINCNIYTDKKRPNYYAFYFEEEIRKFNSSDSIVIDANIINFDLASGYYTNIINRFRQYYVNQNQIKVIPNILTKNINTETLKIEKEIIAQDWKNYGWWNSTAINDTIINDKIVLNRSNFSYSLQNLSIPKNMWYVGKVNIRTGNSWHPNGYIYQDGLSDLSLYTNPYSTLLLKHKDSVNYLLVYIANYVSDTIRSSFTIPYNLDSVDCWVYTNIQDQLHYPYLNLSLTDTLYLLIDYGSNYPVNDLTYLDFNLSVSQAFGVNAGFYNIKAYYGVNHYSTSYKTSNLVKSIIGKFGAGLYDTSKISFLSFGDTKDNRYCRIAFADIGGSGRMAKIVLLNSSGVRRIMITKHRNKFFD